MKKEIREVDAKRGIVQVTTSDSRWYLKSSIDVVTGLPIYKGVPSVTWVCGSYPKGIGFYRWLSEHGWDDSQAIKQAAGDKGSKVHNAISMILAGEEMRIDTKIMNPSTGQEEELTLEEVDCIKSFVDWKNENNPVSIAWDVTVFSDKLEYAGTIDYICKIGDQVYIVDFKTSQYVWTEYELQVSAYKHALIEESAHPEAIPLKEVDYTNIKLAVLQIGYNKNKAKYKWNEFEDAFDLFMNARAIWVREHGGETIKTRDYPIILSPKVEKTDE